MELKSKYLYIEYFLISWMISVLPRENKIFTMVTSEYCENFLDLLSFPGFAILLKHSEAYSSNALGVMSPKELYLFISQSPRLLST